MDFFEAQARAKKRTARLVWLFSLAVAGTVAAGYFATIFAISATQGVRPNRPRYRGDFSSADSAPPATTLWQPKVFLAVAAGTLAVVGFASLYKWHEFSSGGSSVAESIGARPVDPHTTDTNERRLLNVVEEMAIASGVPVPAVFLLADEPAINAFAAGLTTSDAVVCVTRGTMEKLSRDELQGVVGHEFSHILNGDMRLNLRIASIVFGILVIGLSGRGILWSLRNVRLRGKNSGGVVVAIGAAGLALMIVGYVGYFLGRVIQAAVSRQREFLADASAVQFTRNPGGVTGALKKIGGYALGSSLQTHQAAALGHFFFAQGFTSSFDAVWATHPPLPERIRAIDPQFDGKMFDPPTVVDITRESFAEAGFAGGQRSTPGEATHRAFTARADVPPPRPIAKIAFQPAAAVADVGALTEAHFRRAQQLLEALPASLREATHDPVLAPVVVYGLLLDGPSEMRARQLQLVEKNAGPEPAAALARLRAPLSLLDPAARLPLLQLCLPALRQFDPAALERFVTTLDELVHADGVVTPFEFALQKLLLRSLTLGRAPGDATVEIYSFNAVVDEIAIVLSALARASSNVDLTAAAAFAAGAAQLKLIQDRLVFFDESASNLAALDAALDKLATASGPIKQRTLVAAAHVIGADGQILIAEAELLRAISAALDCPMPPGLAAA